MAQETIDKLTALSRNLWWSWNPEAIELFSDLNPTSFRLSHNNPVVALRNARRMRLDSPEYQGRVNVIYDEFQDYLTAELDQSAPAVSYFCMEYGIHESLPLYSGGLGVLAGDHLKAASDLGIPFTAVGIFLKEGYFNQHFDHSGWQHQSHSQLNVENTPFELATDGTGNAVKISVHLGETQIFLQAWKARVGRATLYLLDSEVEETPNEFKQLTHRLYQGGTPARIQKEIVLGIGGIRLLRALGIETDVYHLNEGHCAFLALELMRERLEACNSRKEAESWVKAHCVFTTHTPVPAGHDRFDVGLFSANLAHYADSLDMALPELMSYGRINPDDHEEMFNMTVLALKLSRKTNGVSRLHGEVSRRMWHELWPYTPIQEVPIGHITNGVHLPTWTTKPASDFFMNHIGDWKSQQMNPDFWKKIRELSDEELWEYRCDMRLRLINFINSRLQRQSLPQVSRLHPDALTVGFARRFATYKRAPLLFSNEEEAIRLFTQEDRPLQIIFAGKAHPADEGGKSFIQRIYQMAQHPALRGRILLLENYDIEIGRFLVSGCDVWLNNPRRPMEASGTSGQKVALHGGLNVSILDGWWPEGYNDRNGWAIGYDASPDIKNPWEQDEEDARFLYDTFYSQILHTFYDRDENGVPVEWVHRMKEAIATLPHRFSTFRMVEDYLEHVYKE